jgi:hypothetical protein
MSAQNDAADDPSDNAAHARELANLLEDFAAMPGITARFREERHLALLAAPLVSHGEIAFAPPDRLRRQVTEPVQSLMLVRDGEMVLRDRQGGRVIDLSSQPMVQIFVDGITRLLAGDLDGLQAHYRMRFEPGDAERSAGWSLHLEPRVSPLDEAIARRSALAPSPPSRPRGFDTPPLATSKRPSTPGPSPSPSAKCSTLPWAIWRRPFTYHSSRAPLC